MACTAASTSSEIWTFIYSPGDSLLVSFLPLAVTSSVTRIEAALSPRQHTEILLPSCLFRFSHNLRSVSTSNYTFTNEQSGPTLSPFMGSLERCTLSSGGCRCFLGISRYADTVEAEILVGLTRSTLMKDDISTFLPGQCLAHFIMGSAFIAYAVLLAILLLVGEQWVRRSKRSPDSFDSWFVVTSQSTAVAKPDHC